MKLYSNSTEFKRKIENSVNKISDYVLSTYGPYGKNVLISENGTTFLTKDGVTVAKAVESEDSIENAILTIIKQAADKTVKDAGDGPQPLYSKILTPTGFVEMGSLKVGDKICGTNNSIQEVVDIFPKGQKRIYELKFSNDRIVECCLDHLWDISTSYGVKKTFTTKQLFESKIKTKCSNGYFKHKYYTPITSVDFFDQHQELDPFLVGLLIGDGSLCSNGSIELSLSLYQEHLLEKLVLPENIKFSYTKDLEKNYLRVKFSRKDREGPTMHEYVQRIGLLNKKSRDKFIPKEYLYSSYANRMALLEGLIESDGYVNDRGLIEYSTISPNLCQDFVELMRGLGKQVNIYLKKRKGDSYSNTSIHVISELKGNKYGIKLKDIKETDRYTEMMCIKVSNSDNLYITNDYIVTHNTTTAILFVREFVKIIQSTLSAFHHIPSTEIYNKFQEILKSIFKTLEISAIDIESKKMLRDVAFMASNGDSLIADLVSDLIDAVGVSGSISIKQSKSEKTSIKIMEGMKLNSSVASTLLLNDLNEKKVLNDCTVVVSNTKIAYTDEILRLLANCVENKKSLLFICPDMDEKALLTIIANVQRKAIEACVISPSYLGNEKLDALEDVSLLCGTVVNATQELEKTSWDLWGFCKSVEITKTSTLLIDGKASPAHLDAALASLRGALRDTEDESLIKRLNARIARLTSTLGVLYVGGATQAEITERKHRVEDALESCHSAMKKGIVPGGGSSLLLVSSVLKNNKDDVLTSYVKDRVIELLKSPSKTLYGDKNCLGPLPDDHNATENLLKINSLLDLRTNEFINPIEAGLVESVWTIQAAMSNAFSAAWVLVNSFGAIIGV